MTLTAQTDRTLVRAGSESVRYAMVTFTAPPAARAASRPPVNIALVLDRSGSMAGRKIQLARSALVQSLRMLSVTDRFSVVCYDNEIDVLVPSTLASQEAIANAITQVERLQPRGNTNLSGGWLKGCEQVAASLYPGQIARCILLSDGLANAGITDAGELARHAAALRERGIATSCLGVGDDYDDRLMQGLAVSGRGNFYHVEAAEQIADLLTSELGETLEVVARDVAIRIRPTAGMSVMSLSRFQLSLGPAGTALRLGDLTARQEVSVVLGLKFPRGRAGDHASVVFGVADADEALRMPDTDIVWTFADHAANDAQPRNRVVDRAVARLYAAIAADEAIALNRAGRFKEAASRIEKTARRIEQYAGSDAELREVVAELRMKVQSYEAPMPMRQLKAEMAASFHASRMRGADGKARRGPHA